MNWLKRIFGKCFKFKRIQYSIAVGFSVVILFTISIIAIVSYSLSIDAVKNNSKEYTYQLVQQINTSIESYINYMENISQMVLYNSDVRKYLSNQTNYSIKEMEETEKKISDQFISILNVRKDISNIIIFGSNGRVLLPYKNDKLNLYTIPKKQNWYKKAIAAKGKAVVSSSHVEDIIDNDYRWVVSLSCELTDKDSNGNLGVLLVDLNYSVINNICNNVKLGNKGYIFIVDGEGNLVYHPQQQLIYSNLKSEMIDQVLRTKSNYFVTGMGKDSRIYTIKESMDTGWKIVGVSYIDELVSNKSQMQMYYFLLGIGFLILAIVFSLMISSRISRPIKKLEASMKEVEKGNFDIKVYTESVNEIGELSKAFNIMIVKIKELMRQNIKEQELKRKSELKSLQAQINPHFLYNTLDSIIWMAESKKNEEVVLMASSLAKLFRSSISKGQDIITIESEIEHIKSYLTIQEMRYKDKLIFEVDVEEEIKNKKTIKILLQPLVENSIYHGIKNKEEVGHIKIIGKRIDDKILFQVVDNGIGMTPEKLKSILTDENISPRGMGIGVRNVNERIILYFGTEYGLKFESEPEVGTTVNVWLPVID